ncbi:MAG: polyprenyl synthetase family protein [Bacteroides sp.]|nr:polyprenyl synthetase family protein [Bacteroides sp.]
MEIVTLIKSPICKELEEFNGLFSESLTSSNALLQEVISHILHRNGKRMRPVLMLLLARLYGEVPRETFYAAVSLELLHTASLVHDDVVDESLERRGQPSVNAVFNNRVAVLVGDYLLATCLVEAAKTKNQRILEVISHLGQDLSEGELLQLSHLSSKSFSEETYFSVIRKKTAALFSACTTTAILSVSEKEEDIRFAREFGECIGMCFQIRDDIFDYYEGADIGKPTGHDMLEGRLTLPLLYALNTCECEEMKELAVRVRTSEATSTDIESLLAFARENGGIEYACQVMGEYKERAENLLSAFPDSPVKQSLVEYLNFLIQREK